MLFSHTMKQMSPWQMGQAAAPQSQQTKGLLTQMENKVQRPARKALFLLPHWVTSRSKLAESYTHGDRSLPVMMRQPANVLSAAWGLVLTTEANITILWRDTGLSDQSVSEFVTTNAKCCLWEEGRRPHSWGKKKTSAGRCLGSCVPSGGCLLDDA